MNKIINKFLLAGDKFMSVMDVRHLEFTQSACGQFTKKRNKNIKIQRNRHIYKNKLDKDYLQHDMAYGAYKYPSRRTVLDQVLRDKTFEIACNPQYDGYQCGLTSMV